MPMLIHETVSAHLRQLLTHTEQHQKRLLPQLTDLCRALRTGLTNSPHRELLWKGAWSTNSQGKHQKQPMALPTDQLSRH